MHSFAAWTFKDRRWQPAPVQAEEINAQGDYVLDGGLPYTKRTGTGFFNERDELVVDGGDLGDDFQPQDVTAAQRAGVTRSWKAAFCVAGRPAGWLLIQSLKAPRAWAGAPAVRFDRQKGEISTGLYTYRFDKTNPVLLGSVALGQPPQPAIQDSQFLMPLKTPFFMPDLTFQDDDFTSSIESWQTGPLRVIVAVGVKYSAFLSLFKLHLFSELVFYRNRFVIPTVVQFVFDPASYLKPGSGIAYALRFPDGKPWQVDSNLARLPRAAPSDALGGSQTAGDTPVFYAKGHRPDGSFQVQVRVDEKARRQVPPPFLLKSDDFTSAEAQRFWPWLAQLHGDLGVYLDFARIHKGTYDFGLDLLLSPKADETFADYGPATAAWMAL